MATVHQAALTEAELKNVLTGVQHVRRQYADAGPVRGSRVKADRSAMQKLFGQTLAQAGLSAEPFEKLRVQTQSELRRAADKLQVEAMARAAYLTPDMQRNIESKRMLLEQLPAAPTTTRVTLDKPFLIWQTLGLFVEDTHVEPFNSFARFKLDSTESNGYEELNFYYVFVNPSDRFSLMNVHAFFALKGFCRAGANGGFWPGDRYASLSINVRLNMLEWWNQPPTQPPFQTDQQQLAATLTATAYDFGDPGDIEVLDVFRGFDLSYSQFIIPPLATAVFEPTVAVSYGMSDGLVNIDFASEDFQVLCPFVSVDILT
jgi:hypothetical protein